MKRSYKVAAGIAAALALGPAAGAFAEPSAAPMDHSMGPEMMHGAMGQGAAENLHGRQAEVARKGAMVMPFDLAKTTHYFDDKASGGIETIKANDPRDAEQVRLIRSHLAGEAERFGRGDFSDPARIHGNHMPGMAKLAAAGNALRVSYKEAPDGASLTYTSSDQAVVTAIHDWFAAQRSDHAAHAHLHPGMMMGHMNGPMAGAMMRHGDAAFGADMQLVHGMLNEHEKIRRTVENLRDGIRTVTESDDPQIAGLIKAHVASMEKRLDEGRIFNLFSPTLPVLFENKDAIDTAVEMTEKGAIVTQRSGDAKVVAALQAHAVEVTELAQDGMAAMMRAARARMGH